MIRNLTCIAILTVLAVPPFSFAEDNWPTFRGADRTGVSSDTGLLDRWPEDGPKLVWTAEGAGRGYASVAIADGKLFTLGDGLSTADDDDEYLVCFDQKTGRQLWKSKTGVPWNSGKESWQSSRSTPTVDGDRVYVVTAFGELICFSTAGQEQWRRHLKDDLGGKKADGWGYSESVLIDGDKLICTPGGPQCTMAALDKATGETLWTTAREEDRGAGHASVVIADVEGTKVYVQTTGSGALGVRADDGELLWSYEIQRTTAVIPTPIVRGDLVFFSAGYGTGGALLRQVAQGDGVTVDEIYPPNPKLGNKHGGIVLVGDYLYGDSDDQGVPFCAELMTGETEWKSRGSGKKSASVTAADGKLFIRYSDGTVVLVPASPEEYDEQGSFKVPDSGERPSWAHPVVVGGKLYLREGDKVFCYDVNA
ncbi:outer membrane biogenesis protein BamB [Stieleria maiorica]|uniref:Outer membrane biogenesis protein BamB n=1 Tax=Stieleria maiorica TaxID=2795974 RepID=A0A5B9MNT3_9BACT|nr:PQQ-binding-like beta-propeller repeat protein [Stieleria maiorica]QEG01335.1 outer membrane biogenesis protein BamB [Stieleria maiorica]